MDVFHLNRLQETDFDNIIEGLGGSRAVEDSSVESKPNADYVLNEAIIELKLLEEEGLEKETRRKKVAKIFQTIQPRRPVVVLDPQRLDGNASRQYYNAMVGPIKTQVKKAGRQLFTSWRKLGRQHARVLLAINNGYTALDHDEFASLVVKCAKNDTSKIDYVIAGGMYYYGDEFDHYIIAPFEHFEVRNDVQFNSFARLRMAWNAHVKQQMTDMILGENLIDAQKRPVLDLDYEIGGVRFVKPAPNIGKSSDFYPGGERPRQNSTGIEACPSVAMAFPRLIKQEWQMFKEAMPDEALLQGDYPCWLKWAGHEAEIADSRLRPFVPITIDLKSFEHECTESDRPLRFSSLCEYAATKFTTQAKSIYFSARSKQETGLLHPRYVRVVTQEIGRDKANDMSSIYLVSEFPGLEREDAILENEKLFFEYAVALASAYAIKHGLDVVLHERDKSYC